MTASIAEVVVAECQARESPGSVDASTASAFTAGGGQPRFSVQQLHGWISERQAKLTKLQTEREQAQRQLMSSRAEVSRLQGKVRELEITVAEGNQAAFGLTQELDRLLMIKARLEERARSAVHRLRAAPVMNQDATASVAAQASAATPVASPADRREHSRVPIVTEVGMSTDSNFWVGFSQDISEGGLFIATPDTKPIGARFLVECRLPDTGGTIRCMAEVAWVREYHEGLGYDEDMLPGMGVRFVGLCDEDLTAIRAIRQSREALFFADAADCA